MKLWFCLAVVVFGCLGSVLRADDSDPAMEADLQKLLVAIKANDFTVAVDMMYTPVVQSVGGVAALKAKANEAKTDLLAKGFKIDSYDFNKPYTKISTAERDYVIIPVHTVMEISGHQVDMDSFQLAIRAHGTTKWEYLDGPGIKPQVKAQYFPDLKDTPLPEVKTKMLK